MHLEKCVARLQRREKDPPGCIAVGCDAVTDGLSVGPTGIWGREGTECAPPKSWHMAVHVHTAMKESVSRPCRPDPLLLCFFDRLQHDLKEWPVVFFTEKHDVLIMQ